MSSTAPLPEDGVGLPQQSGEDLPAGVLRWLLPSLADVIFGLVFLLAIQLGANLTHRDGDLGRHIRLGRSILDDGILPTIDVYSHTMAGNTMIPHEWLSQLTFASVERWFGFDGIGVLVAIVSALPWAILYRWLVRRDIKLWLAAGISLLGATASAIHWAARPHIFTWVFVLVWVILLEDFRLGRRRQAWILVPAMVIWANAHGAYIIGVVLIGTYLVGSLFGNNRDAESSHLRTHLAGLLGASFLASLINPAGIETLKNSFAYTGEGFLLQFTTEYNSPDFHSFLFWPFLAMILLTITIPVRRSPTGVLLLVSWTGFALYSFRNIPLYALIVAPLIAYAANQYFSGGNHGRMSPRLASYGAVERHSYGGALSLLLVIIVILNLSSREASPYEFDGSVFPIEALNHIGETPPGERVFNYFPWGGYLEYCCHPTIPVFIDGQTDYYGAELTMEYDLAIKGQPGWDEVLEKYRVDWVLIPPEVALAQILEEADEWTESFRDDTAIIFIPTG